MQQKRTPIRILTAKRWGVAADSCNANFQNQRTTKSRNKGTVGQNLVSKELACQDLSRTQPAEESYLPCAGLDLICRSKRNIQSSAKVESLSWYLRNLKKPAPAVWVFVTHKVVGMMCFWFPLKYQPKRGSDSHFENPPPLVFSSVGRGFQFLNQS